MKETREQIKTVMRQIEGAEATEFEPAELSMDEVMNTLLGRPGGIGDLYSTYARNPAERLEPLAELKYYMPLPEAAGLKQKIKKLIKRVIRKLMKPALMPIVEEQSRFNLATVQAIEEMHRNMEALRREMRGARMVENVKKTYSEKKDGQE